MPDRQAATIEMSPVFAVRRCRFAPVKLACRERRKRIRIWNRLPLGTIAKARKAREHLSPTFGDRLREIALEIAEEQERRRRAELLAHEQHWHLRGEKDAGHEGAQPLVIGEGHETLAERTIAHLVVVLRERYENVGRQVAASLAARPAFTDRKST